MCKHEVFDTDGAFGRGYSVRTILYLNYVQLKKNIRVAPKAPRSLVYVAFNLPCNDAVVTSLSSTFSARRPHSRAAHIETHCKHMEMKFTFQVIIVHLLP